MGQRIDLHNVLCALDTDIRVYYQPPEGMKLTYPCIVYNLSDKSTRYANNRPYGWKNLYDLTYISRSPDDEILDQIGLLEGCRFDRHFIYDNLHHYIYTIHF